MQIKNVYPNLSHSLCLSVSLSLYIYVPGLCAALHCLEDPGYQAPASCMRTACTCGCTTHSTTGTNIRDKRIYMYIYTHLSIYIYIHVYAYVYYCSYISTWRRPSPPPLIVGRLDHMEAKYWSCAPPIPISLPKSPKTVNNEFEFGNNVRQINLGKYLGPAWGAPGSKKATDTKKYENKAGQVRNARSAETHSKDFSLIVVSFRC